MAKEVTRHIQDKVRYVLWGRAAGRCQFNGCNRPLYQSPITLETVNIAEAAHIYSFSKNGPRGWGRFVTNKGELNNINNLMLMCHDCHKTIDQDTKGTKYSADLLQLWKKEHEQRIWTVAGIAPKHKSHVVFYYANISGQKSPLHIEQAISAMFPSKYPASEGEIDLSMNSSLRDDEYEFWASEASHLERVFQQRIDPIFSRDSVPHFSIFSLAPMPLLIKLGALLTDKYSVDTYQPIREPKGWIWQDDPDDFEFIINKPDKKFDQPALVLSLSGKIDEQRVRSVLGDQVDIWEVETPEEFQNNDFIKHPNQLALFRKELRKLVSKIRELYGEAPLSIFPAMPVSCSIELGRIRMPKSDMPWVIYDQNNNAGGFIKTLEINGGNNEK